MLIIVLVVPIKESEPMMTLQQEVKTKVDGWATGESTSDNALEVPSKQEFAINNIQMNMSRKDVSKKLGDPKRVTSNEYGTNWYSYYSDDYRSFVMVSYIDDKVNALYSNQNVISSKSKVKYGTPKEVVRDRLGEQITEKQKGRVKFNVEDDGFDNYHNNQIYTTAFYDKHENNNLTALLQVSEKMENRLQEQYGAPSDGLKKSFELQNFDLVNAERVQHNLPTLD